MASTYATSYEQTTTVTQSYSETNRTSDKGVIDKAFVRSIPGILKLVEVVLAFVAFILVVSSSYYCYLIGANGWFCFVTMFCVVTTVILYIFLLFKLQVRLCRCDCVVWPVVELFYYAGAVVLLFIADVVLSAAACTDLLKAGVAFGWFAFAAYGFELGFKLYQYRFSIRSETTHVETTTTTSTRY